MVFVARRRVLAAAAVERPPAGWDPGPSSRGGRDGGEPLGLELLGGGAGDDVDARADPGQGQLEHLGLGGVGDVPGAGVPAGSLQSDPGRTGLPVELDVLRAGPAHPGVQLEQGVLVELLHARPARSRAPGRPGWR